MPRAIIVIDVQNEYFTGAFPISRPVGHFDNILKVLDRGDDGEGIRFLRLEIGCVVCEHGAR